MTRPMDMARDKQDMASENHGRQQNYKTMDDFLVFNSDRNQFKWTGSVEQFGSFVCQRLNVSKKDV